MSKNKKTKEIKTVKELIKKFDKNGGTLEYVLLNDFEMDKKQFKNIKKTVKKIENMAFYNDDNDLSFSTGFLASSAKLYKDTLIINAYPVDDLDEVADLVSIDSLIYFTKLTKTKNKKILINLMDIDRGTSILLKVIYAKPYIEDKDVHNVLYLKTANPFIDKTLSKSHIECDIEKYKRHSFSKPKIHFVPYI